MFKLKFVVFYLVVFVRWKCYFDKSFANFVYKLMCQLYQVTWATTPMHLDTCSELLVAEYHTLTMQCHLDVVSRFDTVFVVQCFYCYSKCGGCFPFLVLSIFLRCGILINLTMGFIILEKTLPIPR